MLAWLRRLFVRSASEIPGQCPRCQDLEQQLAQARAQIGIHQHELRLQLEVIERDRMRVKAETAIHARTVATPGEQR